ncbi:MAG: DNA gyrase inhibitor YacG [Phycisphaeraceae bacterium]|nr:MAG: DNA gyrase inhibitor YacG [Phycisphaeraceae bacterium]
MESKHDQLRCRTCGAELPADTPGPFCSPRCRMADLGKWFSGDYSISRNIEERDLDED